MRIGIDIRPLLEDERGGVGEYTHELLRALFHIDKTNEYFLFANSFEEKSLPEFQNSNVKIYYNHVPNKLFNAGLNFLHWPKIDKLLLREGKIDLFFMPNMNFVSLRNNVPNVITFHDLSYEIYPTFFNIKERLWHKSVNPLRLANRAQKIISVSENTKNDLVNIYKINPDKIKVVPLGIKNDFFRTLPENELIDIRKKMNLPEKFILFLASWEDRKNPLSLLEAFASLCRDNNFKDIYLVFVGRDKKSFKIKKYIKKLQIESKTRIIGYVPSHLRPALYQLAKIFVYPSYYEGFGLPPLEAMAGGTPVIASHTSSLPEVLGSSAILIDPYNVNDILSSLKALLTDKKTAENFIKMGKERAKQFNWMSTAQKTLEVFNEAGNKNFEKL